MKEEQDRFLRLCGHAPVRLTVEQTAWILNCQEHDIPILVAARLLRPLGNPAPNATKFFSTAEVFELSRDRAWLTRVTAAVSLYWQRRNAAKNSATPITAALSPMAVSLRRKGDPPVPSSARESRGDVTPDLMRVRDADGYRDADG